MTLKGTFKPINKHKYIGRHIPIYRSGWERKVMTYLDTHPDVISWGSESHVIPYYSPVDRKMHRYYPDFVVQLKDANGEIRTQMWEVKPLKQTMPPKPTKIKGRPTKRYLTEAVMYTINEAKWAAARAFCESKNWDFVLLTEKNIFG